MFYKNSDKSFSTFIFVEIFYLCLLKISVLVLLEERGSMCVWECLHEHFISILENTALKPSVSVDNVLKSSVFSPWSDCFVVQLLSHVQLFATPWTAALLVFLSFTISQEFAQTHIHWVSDAIPPSHSLSPPSLLVLNSLLVEENLLVLCIL